MGVTGVEYRFDGRVVKAETMTNGDLRLKIDVDRTEKHKLTDLITRTEADGVAFGIAMVELE
jgi:hypothetical protein